MTIPQRWPYVRGSVVFRFLFSAALYLIGSGCPTAAIAQVGPLLLRDPTVSRTQIAFSYAGSLWIVNRDESGLHQLTHGPGDRKPAFSPDGSLLAYTADYVDAPYGDHHSNGIFVVPAKGGSPRQLTFHPCDLTVTGWTPDGKRILFTSRRTDIDLNHQTFLQLFSVPVTGGPVIQLPLPRAAQASLSRDSNSIAYVPNIRTQPEWKRYRGGQTTPIWIARLADSRLEARIPRDNSNDSNPMWVGNSIYFLSDRSGPVTLFEYNLRSQKVRKVVDNDAPDTKDIKSASATSDAIIYEQFGSLHLLDIASGTERTLNVRPAPDLAYLLPHGEKMRSEAPRFVSLSPDGHTVLFNLHAEVLTASVDNNGGVIRDITRTTDVVERDPSWSPDARWIAYFSDESGEYALHIRDPEGSHDARKIDLGKPSGFYYGPRWSPDSQKIAYTDLRLNYWYVDVNSGKRTRFDTDLFVNPRQQPEIIWSPDGRWIAYTRQLPNHLHGVFVYSLEEARSYQITDGGGDALHIAFDDQGRLYFTLSMDVALATGWMQMSSLLQPVTRDVYSIDVQKALHSHTGATDPHSLSRQTVALHVPPRNYCDLITGPPGKLFLVEWPERDPRDSDLAESAHTKVYQLDVATGRVEPMLDEVVDLNHYSDMTSTLRISFDGKRMVYAKHGHWFVAETAVPITTAVALELEDVEIRVDPRAEWKHMFAQIWRNERDFFYDPDLHGLDIPATMKSYQPFLDNITSRDDLGYLFNEMLGNLTVGHLATFSPTTPESRLAGTGLLGADYDVDQGRYRFARIHGGDPWSRETHGPLTEPGVDIHVGDTLLAVNGRDVRATRDIYSFFQDTVGKDVVLTIAPRGDVTHSRNVTVVPVGDETPLRNYSWVENNRHKVDQLSGGHIAYVYLPDVYLKGYRTFNRDYFSQVGKEGLIIDERFNYGGIEPDYIIDCLNRPLMYYSHTRYGHDIVSPKAAIFGPKAMIINEMSASGGDLLAWMFHKAGLGALVGARTWGGLVAGYAIPDDLLLDGGVVATPDLAFYDTEGAWIVENQGVAPDIAIEEEPGAAREGRDPQLEGAVSYILQQLRTKEPTQVTQHPPFPNYQNPRSPGYPTVLRNR